MDYICIDSVDEDGFTPLHYACILRMTNIVTLLHAATADVTTPDRLSQFTALHWSAVQLDDTALRVLCSHVFDVDIHDHLQRTPLVLACLEGRDRLGKTNTALLSQCLKVLLEHSPSVFYWKDSAQRNILHYLAASWQYEALELLLEYSEKHHLHHDEVNAVDTAQGFTPLHYAIQAIPLKASVGEGVRIVNQFNTINSSNNNNTNAVNEQVEDLNRPFGVNTLKTLLRFGAKPNLKDAQNRSPMQLLLTNPAALLAWQQTSEVFDAVTTLTSFGARVDDNLINLIRQRTDEAMSISAQTLTDPWTSLGLLDCNPLDIR